MADGGGHHGGGPALDVGERLFRRATASFAGKRSSADRAASLSAMFESRCENIDVRDEVERMYQRALAAVEGNTDGPTSGHTNQSAGGCDEGHDGPASPPAIPRLSMAAILALRSNTFGSSRRGLTEPVRKADGPGPGSYYRGVPADAAATSSIGSNTPRWSIGSGPRSGRTPAGVNRDERRRGLDPTLSAGATNLASAAPGPGEYTIPSTFADVAKKPTAGNSKTHTTFGRSQRSSIGTPRSGDCPGPGHYALNVGPKPPSLATASFSSKAARLPKAGGPAPGPGRYEVESAERFLRAAASGAVAMRPSSHSRSISPPSQRHATPGPGTYNLADDPGARRAQATRGVIPTAGRPVDELFGVKLTDSTPGPGSYDTEGFGGGFGHEAPAFSIRHTVTGCAPDAVPGPGAYFSQSLPTSLEGPRYSMNKAVREGQGYDHAAASQPGPADYSTAAAVAAVTERPPRAVMGTAPRTVLLPATEAVAASGADALLTPGPGSYEPMRFESEAAPRAAGFGIGERSSPFATALDAAVPGPGSYDIRKAETAVSAGPTAAVMGTQPRMLDVKSSTLADVGPGSYDVAAATEGPTAVIGTAAARGAVEVTSVDVGPGSYDTAAISDFNLLASTRVGIAIGLPLPPKRDPVDAGRGPGTYDIPPTVPSGPAATFGTSASHRFADCAPTGASVLPGPGSYDPSGAATEVPGAHRAAVMGTEQRALGQPTGSTGPHVGPGTYALPPAIGAITPGSTIGTMGTGRRETAELSAGIGGPGPGSYELATTIAKDAPTAVFGTGPGHPQPESPSAGHPQSPGPGSYAPAQFDTATCGPSATIGTAPRATSEVFGPVGSAASPGPAAYDPRMPQEYARAAILTTTSSRLAPTVTSTAPGPGAYDATDVRAVAPAVTIGSAVRVTDVVAVSDVPGPGSYATDGVLQTFGADARVGHAVATDARFHTPPTADIPGPGTYDTSIGPRGSIPVTFGTAPRAPASVGSGADAPGAPGPGAYNPQPSDLPRAPAATLQGGISRADAMSMALPGAGVPGPGSYIAAQLSFGIGAPAAVFGALTDMRSDRGGGESSSPGPGPGAYDPPTPQFDKGPSAVFGSSIARLPARNSELPGPGAYLASEPNTLVDASGAVGLALTATRSGLVGSATQSTPGPGSYVTSDAVRAVLAHSYAAFFPTGQPPTLESHGGLGPGAYDPILLPHNAAPSYSFGTARPTGATVAGASDVAPGPGAYSVGDADAAVRPHPPAVTMGTAARLPPGDGIHGAAGRTPGPGSYAVDSTLGLMGGAPAFTINATSRAALDAPFAAGTAHVPGPGAYDTSSALAFLPGGATASIPFATAPRFDTVKQATGGVELLGPGAYQLPPLSPGPSAFMPTYHPADAPPAALPGPGHYLAELDTIGKNSRSAVFATAQPPAAPTSLDPGPGQYDAHLQFQRLHAGPSVTIPATSHLDDDATRRRHDANTPGPGQYDLQLSAGRSAIIPLAQRPSVAAGDVPGPGHYDPARYGEKHGAGPAAFITGRHAEPSAHADVPGPAAYDGSRGDALVFEAAPKYTIPGRYADAASEDERRRPGPGQYDLGSTLRDNGITIAQSSHPSDALKDVPGPGMYNVADAAQVPAHRFSQASRDAGLPQPPDGPAVGWYNISNGLDVTKERPPAYTIGQGAREPHHPDAAGTLVGPGYYNLGKPPHEGPAYSIAGSGGPGGSGAVPQSDTPGPGYYNVRDDGSHGISFTTANRDPGVGPNGDIPGPGKYNLQNYDPYRRDGGARDLSKVPPMQSFNVKGAVGPGPGLYHVPLRWDEGGRAMGGRYREGYQEVTPGPPDYHPVLPVPAFHTAHSGWMASATASGYGYGCAIPSTMSAAVPVAAASGGHQQGPSVPPKAAAVAIGAAMAGNAATTPTGRPGGAGASLPVGALGTQTLVTSSAAQSAAAAAVATWSRQPPPTAAAPKAEATTSVPLRVVTNRLSTVAPSGTGAMPSHAFSAPAPVPVRETL